jgi:hypothetical protein
MRTSDEAAFFHRGRKALGLSTGRDNFESQKENR